MKLLNKYFLMAMAVCLSFTACSDDDDNWSPGPQEEGSGIAGAYFHNGNETLYEVDPTAETVFPVTVCRLDSVGALSLPIEVLTNDSNVFVVPEAVEFADGAKEATFNVRYDGAKEGVTYNLSIAVPQAQVSLYKEFDGAIDFSCSVVRIKWNEMGTGYFLDGTTSYFFGVDPTVPMAVKLYQAEVGGNTRLRFASPFAYGATAVDEVGGYDAYPYNQSGQYDEQLHWIILDFTENGVSMSPLYTGMDWGYGKFMIGSVYGNLSSNIKNYPLGVYEAEAGCIVFPANSLFISMSAYNDGACYPCDTPTYLFLSADAYKAYITPAE